MTFKKNDFLEIEFTGKIKNGDIFDSNIPEVAKQINPSVKTKPYIFALGNEMFIKGVDSFLIGKDIGEYKIEISPENGFGQRDPSRIKKLPQKIFTENKLNPYPGVIFNFDNEAGKVLAVSSGRVLVDFNHPLAGKLTEYQIKVLRKVTDINEKINALNDFFFKQQFKFIILENQLQITVPKLFIPFFNPLKKKYKSLLDLDLIIIEDLNKK